MSFGAAVGRAMTFVGLAHGRKLFDEGQPVPIIELFDIANRALYIHVALGGGAILATRTASGWCAVVEADDRRVVLHDVALAVGEVKKRPITCAACRRALDQS